MNFNERSVADRLGDITAALDQAVATGDLGAINNCVAELGRLRKALGACDAPEPDSDGDEPLIYLKVKLNGKVYRIALPCETCLVEKSPAEPDYYLVPGPSGLKLARIVCADRLRQEEAGNDTGGKNG